MAERKINLDDRKYDALKRIFAEQGRDIDEEIVAQIEAMYEDLVPKAERDRIEHDTEPIYPQGSFAIYSFKDQGETIYFTSSDVMTLYESARLYRELEANDERSLTLDSIAYRYFGEDRTEIISENLFSVLTKAMANDERITAAIEYNLDSECVKVHGRDGVTIKHFTLDTLMDFLEAAELALVRNEAERGKTFERFLEGKEYLTELTTSKDYLIARLIVCEAASKVVNEDMDYMDGGYVDPLSDSLHNERKGLLSAIGQGASRDIEIVSPHLKELIGEYTDKLWSKGFPEHYGWDKRSVTNAIVNAIQPQEVRELAGSATLDDSDEDIGITM